ncbi:MAG: porin [Azospira sp.]|jgi:predicted porin|nr:porin [Azospira sp.]
MQKKLIALAVAGLASTAAFAQSNVTIYGIVDAGFVSSSGDRTGAGGSANYNGIDSGNWAGSRIGFRGEEGLGNGLKAVFTLEYGLVNDQNQGIGTAGTVARQQFVGLSSAKLGTVALGRQYAPGFIASVRNDAFAGSPVGSPLQILSNAGNHSISASGRSRINNSITYTSPVMAGFQAKAIYGYGENNAGINGISTGNDGFVGVGLSYTNGPIAVDAVYQSQADRVVAGVGTSKDVDNWMLAGSYDFKVAKLFAVYQTQENDTLSGAASVDNKLWNLGVTVPVFGNGKVHASYGKLNWDRSGAGDSTSVAVGYTHALSKRTSLYTTYIRTDNDRNALAAAGSITQTRFVGETNDTFMAGVTHTF